MPEFIPFYTKTFGDKKFKSLTKEGTLLFFYLIGNESITLTGIYELDIEVCKIRSKTRNEFGIALKELIDKQLIDWDDKEDLIWIINRFKLIPTKSPKVVVGAIEELNLISHPFKEKFIVKYKDVLNPYMYRLNGQKLTEEQALGEDFIINASKIYNSKPSLKRFLTNRGIPEVKIDEVLAKILPNLK